MIKLYDYFRSTASYRVRIALNWKELPHELIEVHLVKEGGQQKKPDYLSQNPQGLVPALIDGDMTLTQSLAILEYLEEQYPTSSLLPENSTDKALVRSIAQIIACDIHPLNNLRVLKYLAETLEQTDETKTTWYHHWIQQGFDAIEALLAKHQSNPNFCIGEQVSIADVCLIPQIYNANRFECDLSAYPRIMNINNYCLTLPAFDKASPPL